MPDIEQIFESIKASEAASQSKSDWNPAQQGEIDIRIAADGIWFHQGRAIERESMIKLFASVLRREASGYYLVTPAEKLRIQVDDAPFVANLMESMTHNHQPVIVFTTNIGERVALDETHGLRIEENPTTGEPRPYVQLHCGLEALISRSAFFDLINLAEEHHKDGVKIISVASMGLRFELGRF